jgi:hypothetical protein
MKLLFDIVRDSSIVLLLVLFESPTKRDKDDCNFGCCWSRFFIVVVVESFFDEFDIFKLELWPIRSAIFDRDIIKSDS